MFVRVFSISISSIVDPTSKQLKLWGLGQRTNISFSVCLTFLRNYSIDFCILIRISSFVEKKLKNKVYDTSISILNSAISRSIWRDEVTR